MHTTAVEIPVLKGRENNSEYEVIMGGWVKGRTYAGHEAVAKGFDWEESWPMRQTTSLSMSP